MLRLRALSLPAAVVGAALAGCVGRSSPRARLDAPTIAVPTAGPAPSAAPPAVVPAAAPPTPAPAPTPAPPAAPTAAPAAGTPPTASPPVPLPTPPPMSPDTWWAIAMGSDRPALDCVPRAAVCGFEGDLTVRARARLTSSDDDVDLYEHLRLRWRREDAPGWSASMHVRAAEDVDGSNHGSSFSPFASIDDTYDAAVQVRLYHLYANHHEDCGVLEQLRVGRQDVSRVGEWLHLDGAHLVLRPSAGDTRLYAFGGVPTHLYDTSHQGDWVVGGGASFTPWCGASVEVGDAWFEDVNGLYGRTSVNLAAAEATQRLSPFATVRAGYQQLDEEPRRAWGSFDAHAPACDLSVRGSLRTQILTERREAYDVDPFFAVLLDLEPYWEASLSASKGLGDVWTVEAGGQARRLFDRGDRGTFNHDFSRAYATVSARDLPWRCVGLAVTGEWWRSEDGEDVGSFGFEADWRPAGPLRLTAGIDYALYRTDLFTASERYDSYGAFVRARYTDTSGRLWTGSLRADTDDYDVYWTVDLAVRIEF